MGNLNTNLEALFSKMEGFVSTKTVIGDPININNVIILPLVEVTFGVGAGSTDQNEDKNGKETGAGGLGAKITPSAVLVIQDGNVQLVNIKNPSSVDRLIDMVPGIISKTKLDSFFSKKSSDDKKADNDMEN